MTLQELKYNYVFCVLVKNDYKRGPAAKELGISLRGLRDTINQMAAKGFDVRSRAPNAPKYEDEEKDVELVTSKRTMPTNKERIAYRDWLINADYIKNMPKRPASL